MVFCRFLCNMSFIVGKKVFALTVGGVFLHLCICEIGCCLIFHNKILFLKCCDFAFALEFEVDQFAYD